MTKGNQANGGTANAELSELDVQEVYDAEFAHTIFVEELLKKMEHCGVSHETLAKLIGKSERYIKGVFKGKDLTFSEAARLAAALGSHFVPRVRTKRQRASDAVGDEANTALAINLLATNQKQKRNMI